MARKRKSAKDDSKPSEEAATASSGEEESTEHIDPTPLVDEAPVRGSVVTPPSETKAASPPTPVEKYRVVNGGRIVHRGNVTMLKSGKTVTALNYDLDKLREQGIKLERVED